MDILILNSILYTAENNQIPRVNSIKDTMIYNFALGFVKLGHNVTLVAAEEYKPIEDETYDFELIFLKSSCTLIFKVGLLPLHLSLYGFLKKRKLCYDLVISSEAFSINTFIASLIIPEKLIIWQELGKHNRLLCKIPSLFWYNIIVPVFYRKTCVIPRSKQALTFISKYAKLVVSEFVEHGINLDKFVASANKKKQFVVVAQLVKRKRIDRIILNFKSFIADERYQSYKLLIIGRGEQECFLQQLVNNEGLNGNVLFLGFLSHSQLSVHVSESLGLLIDTERDLNMVSIPESIAAGTPVLTNTVPASSFYVKMNKLGIVKDGWTSNDLEDLVINNEFYVANCLRYKDKLSNTYVANRMIELFNVNK
ncbi:glycosyltransferase [Parabacteroides sp. AM08-6]|uniref:glycosyltransferase n=1 Tax=Parabacteroides sp. AM08-6 TaxID=2292053 RepID=UPI000F00235C|nr:glycosyltransferase [Parabacteroides sp. AM08-6]RHJ84367.1 glycosyltransferase [Parabacteroides sp. AM08-6]